MSKLPTTQKALFASFQGNAFYEKDGSPSMKEIRKYFSTEYRTLTVDEKHTHLRKIYITQLIQANALSFAPIWDLFVEVSNQGSGPAEEWHLTTLTVKWQDKLWMRFHVGEGYEELSPEAVRIMFTYIRGDKQCAMLKMLPSPYIDILIPIVLRHKQQSWKELLLEVLQEREDEFSLPEEWLAELYPFVRK